MTPAILILILGFISPQWQFQTSQKYVTSIFSAEDGTMWCSTAGGILQYDPEVGWKSTLIYPADIPYYRINDISVNDTDLWLATDGAGLALRQDDSWTIFTTFDGVPGTGVVYAVHRTSGYIFAGTDGGLAIGDETGFTPLDEYTTGDAFKAQEVTGISSAGDSVYFATNRGIYILDLNFSPFSASAWTSFEDATMNQGLSKVYACGIDSLFGYGDGGIAFLEENGQWHWLLDYSVAEDSIVTGLLSTEYGLLCSCKGVRRYTGSGWETFGDNYRQGVFSSCLGYACGSVWVGYGFIIPDCHDTGFGLGRYSSGNWESIDILGMPGPSCYQIAFDEQRQYLGSHWMGLMAFYPDSGWQNFSSFTAPMPNTLRTYSAAVGEMPGVWTGSYSFGLTWINDRGTFEMDDDTIITFVSDSITWLPGSVVQVVSPLLNNQVVMLASQGDAIWIAQETFWQTPDEPSGIVALAGNPETGELVWQERTEEDGLAAKNIQMLYPCGTDSLWIAFASEGGCQLLVHGGDPTDSSSDKWYPGYGEAYTTASGLPSGQVFCFTRDNNGNVIAGTGSGISRFQNGEFSMIAGVTGAVKAIEKDAEGRLWCMSNGSITCIDGSDVFQYTEENSDYIPSTRVENEFSFRDPADDKIYFSSQMGLWSIAVLGNSAGSSVPVFYPQPFLPAEENLHLIWAEDAGEIEVSIFTIDGIYLGTVKANSPVEWIWDGCFDGREVATGVYIVIIKDDTAVAIEKIAIVR